MRIRPSPSALVVFVAAVASPVLAQPEKAADPARRLQGFDAYMEKLVKDWNVPGIGVARDGEPGAGPYSASLARRQDQGPQEPGLAAALRSIPRALRTPHSITTAFSRASGQRSRGVRIQW